MPFNKQIFFLLNGLAGKCVFLDGLWIFLADYAIFIFGLYLIYLAKKNRKLFLQAALSAVIAVIAVAAVNMVCFLPRPFLGGKVKLLVTSDPKDSTFPSTHASVAFALAGALFLKRKKIGFLLLTLASLVSLSRVIAGAHYPLDILGGAFLGWIAAYSVSKILPA